ncbi:MAG: hypothetical protein GY795_05035 [Desulfobacterales bacterium]|nr:hypothetical protein [Desulfobacterales bacterium]
MSEKIFDDDFALYALKKGDILICRTNGNPKLVGKSALVAKDYPYVYESHLFKIRPNSNLINSETLAVYLNTFNGKLEIEKFSMQGNQANFSLAKLKELRVPKFSRKLNHIIARIVNLSFSMLTKSEYSYQKAQTLLLSELGLTDWQPKHHLCFVKNYSETEQAKRLDAEHFQPSCDDILHAVQKTGQSCTLADTTSMCQRGKQPKYCAEGKLVINSKHVRSGEVVVDNNRQGMVSNASVIIQQGDILINGTGVGTIGRCAPYLHDYTALPDNHVTVLRAKGIDPIFLATQLNSVIGQEQVKKFQRGSSGQIELYPDDIKKFVIWKAPQEIQQKIRDKIKEGHNAKLKSQALLDCAKRAVELAIEQDEQTAMDWLKEETKAIQ